MCVDCGNLWLVSIETIWLFIAKGKSVTQIDICPKVILPEVVTQSVTVCKNWCLFQSLKRYNRIVVLCDVVIDVVLICDGPTAELTLYEHIRRDCILIYLNVVHYIKRLDFTTLRVEEFSWCVYVHIFRTVVADWIFIFIIIFLSLTRFWINQLCLHLN